MTLVGPSKIDDVGPQNRWDEDLRPVPTSQIRRLLRGSAPESWTLDISPVLQYTSQLPVTYQNKPKPTRSVPYLAGTVLTICVVRKLDHRIMLDLGNGMLKIIAYGICYLLQLVSP